jgi:phosphoribosylanthranilate isomerase
MTTSVATSPRVASRGWIKICGMTDAEAVSAALEAGVDALGFVFAPSVRRLPPAEAAQIAAAARGRVSCIAVTRHPDIASVQQILRQFAPDILQSDAHDFATLDFPAGCERLPVYRSGQTSASQAEPGELPGRLLFEGPVSGSGETSDWLEAAALARRTELILAGGLHADNVTAAIHRVRPFGVDVSSGVEVAPGRKSPQRIFEFVKAARAAFESLPRIST